MVSNRDDSARHLDPRGGKPRTARGSTTVRRASSRSGEVFLLSRACDDAAGSADQVDAAYQSMLEALLVEGLGPDSLVSETIFFRHIDRDFRDVFDARRRALERSGNAPCNPPATFIGQPPLDPRTQVEIAAVAVPPDRRDAFASVDVTRVLSCSCESCRHDARASLVRVGGQTQLRAANIYGSGRSPTEQAQEMFRIAERLLDEVGMTFRDVIRTWIYLRDIDRHYALLNEARRDFFGRCGIGRRPASTGVQGAPFPEGHDFSMSFYALKSTEPFEVSVMSTPTLNEAWTYGAEFSRGLRVADADKVTLHVSGTASIDEGGRSLHAGDFEAQVGRMLYNLETLLSAQGAKFDDVVSAVTYLKRPSDAPALRDLCTRRGFDGFPCAVVEAPLCRPELLCEAELVAVLPLGASRA